MDSDNEDNDRRQFAKAGGDALNLDDDDGFAQNDSEDVENEDEDDMMEEVKKASARKAAAVKSDVKGDKLDNQPYDLAVDVNDSEEIESDEEDDEVNMNDVGRSTQNEQARQQM